MNDTVNLGNFMAFCANIMCIAGPNHNSWWPTTQSISLRELGAVGWFGGGGRRQGASIVTFQLQSM